MTILYRQVRITSAGQLDALPMRTPVMIGPFLAWRSDEHSGWSMTLQDVDVTSEDLFRSHSDDWDYLALVPFEADSRPIQDPEGTPFTYYEAWVRES